MAPLPWAKWRGPVGLAETNSMLTDDWSWKRLFWEFRSQKKNWSFKKKLIKPGPAISILENSSEEKLSIIDFAKSNGFCLYNLENFKAILVVKSPFSSKSSETSISSIDISILVSILLRLSFNESLI